MARDYLHDGEYRVSVELKKLRKELPEPNIRYALAYKDYLELKRNTEGDKILNLIDNPPDRIKIDKKTYRPIFFQADRLEKRCRDFVIGYEQDAILKVLGLAKDSQRSITDSFDNVLQGTTQQESVTSVTFVT